MLHTYVQIKLVMTLAICNMYLVPLLEIKFFGTIFSNGMETNKLLNLNP